MSKGNAEFRGMMPILPTAIQESGELDIVSQCRLVEYCLKCGAVAIGHLGGASEHYMVPAADRRKLIEITVREVAGKVPVFIGATATTARIAAEYAREAEDLGADMLMVGIPFVNAPNRNELYDYYAAVADAVSIPIMVQETSAVLDVDLICRMYDEIEQIQSVKSEGPDFLTKCATLMERTQGEIPLIGGAGGHHMIHLLRMGITAFVTGTEALDIHAAVVKAYLDGDEDTAADIFYQRLMPYLAFYTEHYRELLKAMFHRRGIIDCPKVIPPTGKEPMSEAKWRQFEWVLERVGLNNRFFDTP